jgi:drug/metabolite transporter (DMT)-like permease
VRHLDRTDALLATLVAIWGSAFAGIKVLGEVLDPYEMTWFRYAPFLVLYGVWLVARRRATFPQVTGREWLTLGTVGIVGVIGYHFALNWSLHDDGSGASVSAAVGAILVATTPLWTLLIAVATGKERFRLLAGVGSLVAFVGVAVVVFLGRGEVELAFARKAFVALIAPISWAVYSVFTKPLIARHGGLFVTGVSLGLGTLPLVPLGLSYGTAPLADFALRHWAWLAFLALLSTALGYAMWNQALKMRSASQVTVYIYFNPVVATAVAWLILDEPVTAWFVAGSALVLAGVVLVNHARTSPQPPAPAVAKS